ncbi:MAG: cupin domain-containing protein [Candidatus Lokiarchaeota archaeon]|nr:cupin domain-containing protein [Candidatus Lokiarchaeota archaeon]
MKVSKKGKKEIKMIDGIYRTTMAHQDQLMLVHFRLEKGAILPMHSHSHVQAGYVVKGKLEFWEGDSKYLLESGDSYICQANIPHGAKILENSIVIDSFVPKRDDYI